MKTALAVKQLHFSFIIPDDWEKSVLQVGFRVRGMLGLALKTGCCFFDAQTTDCQGCVKRPHCHYGQSFETRQAVTIEGLGKAGSIPHAWALSLGLNGMRAQATLTMAGFEIAHQESWRSAIAALNLNIIWQPSTWFQQPFAYQWQAITPLRLRIKGKTPREHQDINKAVLTSIVSKMQMLAALHGTNIPESRLPLPECSHTQWCEINRFSFRTKKEQDLSGWLLDITWPQDLPSDWQPWLNLAMALGVGRQTSFGLGRLTPLLS